MPRAATGTLLLVMIVMGCAPTTQPNRGNPQPAYTFTSETQETFELLAAPFRQDLDRLGISILSSEAYRYDGVDEDAFLTVVNNFYRENPGFCPLTNAFFIAPSGVVFMTLASDDGSEVRGFLYDQSRRPRLLYAYFEGASSRRLAAIACETASP